MGVPSLVGSRPREARLKGPNDDFPVRGCWRRHWRRLFIIFLYRALSASHFKSRAGLAPQQTRLLEPAVASHVSLTRIAPFESASCELRPAGQMKSVGYKISLQDHCTRNIFASSAPQSCPISSSILMLPLATSNNT